MCSRASVRISATAAAPSTTGSASAGMDTSPPRRGRAAVTMPPIQARNVPSIHQMGRYHHVLPPATASHVHGKACNGRRTTMSTAMKTIVPHRPIAAALAIPCVVRDVAKNAGSNAAETQAARYHEKRDDSGGGHQPDDGPTEQNVAELGAIGGRRSGHALLEGGYAA